MANTVAGVHLGPDTHANRPDATAVTAGTLYSCSDHDLIYRSDGSTWTTWADLTGGGASLGAWTSYTPTWASDGTTTLGDGSLVGRYKAFDANTYAIQINFAWGSTTSDTGTGTWSFSLPSGLTSVARTQILAGWIIDAAADNKLASGVVPSSGTTVSQVIPEGGNTVTKAAPMTWANGDQLALNGIIEVA